MHFDAYSVCGVHSVFNKNPAKSESLNSEFLNERMEYDRRPWKQTKTDRKEGRDERFWFNLLKSAFLTQPGPTLSVQSV